jgi:spermidine synthase
MWCASSDDPDVARRASVNWIMLIYFASGACSLIDEVVWVRLLKLTLGNTVYATSIVVSVFMGGLALGALIMSRYSDRVRGRLQLYALLETLVTISALSLPWALKLADSIYVWFYRTYHPTHPQLLLIQVIISAAILLVPSMLMGSTLPLLGRFVTALERQAGHLVGKLYALNTLGAAAGCFLAGFVLIRAAGVMGALYTAAALNLLVAFGGWFLSRFSSTTTEEQPETAEGRGHEVVVPKTPDGKFYLLIVAFFMSGLISIGYELLWMRSIVHLLGGFTYVFSAVLTVYLLGNVIGAGIGSRLAMRLKTPAAGFAVTLSVLGICGLLYLPLLIMWTLKVLPYLERTLSAGYSWTPSFKYTLAPLLHSVFLFLVPATVMGIGFPIALQAWANHLHKVGRSTGTAYGANTIGAVMGGIVTGFILIPLLGVQISISVLGLIGIWIAAVMWLVFTQGSKVLVRGALLAVAGLLTVLTVKTSTEQFNTVVKINPRVQDYGLVWVEEGLTTTVSLHRAFSDGSLHMYSSGVSIAGDSYIGRGDQKMLGHFGILLNSDAKAFLSVGFGSGETTACLAWHKPERVDCVEIAPEVVKVALEFFKHINLGDKLENEVNMVFMDAKNYIHLTDTSYDVIINDSIHPRTFAENASLYTKEYFESAKEHLNENGMIISWIPTYSMPASVVKSIIGTLLDVFPHVTLWCLTPNLAPLVMVAGSEQQQYFSPKHIENELRKQGVRDSLSETNIYNNMDVLSCYIADENDLRECIKDFSINSDYAPFVEFTTDSIVPKTQIFRQFVINVRGESVYKHIDWTGFSKESKARWLADYQKLYKVSSYLFKSYDTTNSLDELKYSLDGLEILPDNPPLLNVKANAQKQLFSDSVKLILAGKADDALVLARDILKIHPRSAIGWMIRSSALQNKGQLQEALAAANRAVQLAPDSADARFNLGFILFNLGRFEEAIDEYKHMLRLAEQVSSEDKAKMLDALASAYAATGQLHKAVSTAEKAFELASSTGQKGMAEHIRKRLLLLRSERTSQQRR